MSIDDQPLPEDIAARPAKGRTPRNVRLLYLHNFLNDFCFQLPFVVVYFNQITGSYVMAMAVLAVERLAAAVMDIPMGIFSDRWGRKATLICGAVSYTVAYTFYAFAGATEGLMIGAVFSGLARCLFSGNNNALLYESLKERGLEKEFHHYHGRAGAMFQLALGLSAVCGGFLAVYGLHFVFVISIVPQFLMIPVSLLFTEPRIHASGEHQGLAHLKIACRHAWHNKKLRLLILAQAVGYGAGESNFRFMGAYVNSLWPVWAVGLYRGLNHTCGFTGFWFAGRLVDKIGKPRMLIATNIVPTFLQITAAGLSNMASPILLALGSFFFGPETVACDQLMQDDFTDAQRATLGSVSSLMGSLSYALCAIGIGVISDHFGLAAGIAFGAVAGFVALPLFMHLFRRHFS